jgi:phytoene desaturase
MAKQKAIVIGAGAGGLAAAIRLSVLGYAVSVFEESDKPGGKLGILEECGYRFDTGPSLFTMPWHVTELFELAGKKPEDYFQYSRLPELTRYFWDNGKEFIAPANPEDFVQTASAATGEPAENITKYLSLVQKKYNAVGELFLYRAMNKLSTYTNPKALKAYPQMPALGLFKSMAKEGEQLLQTPEMQQYFNRFATYNGSDPWQVPALLSVIPYLEHYQGAYFPAKGMYGITEALYQLAIDLGVEFHFNNKVTQINTAAGKTMGITDCLQTHHPADITVCNMDVVNAYKHLLPTEKHPTKLLNQPKSSSALIFYWGINRSFPELGLHNIFFSNDYKAEFESIFKEATIGADPTVYINITSKLKPDDAPEGCENWFVMINVPNNQSQDWDALIAEARKNIISKLSNRLGVNLDHYIVTERQLDPRTIESKTSSAQGALYGISSNNRMAAFMRHQNKSPYLKNLYFVGGSVHPGGGVPLALASAKIAVGLVEEGR